MKKIFIFIISSTIYLSAITSGIYKIDDIPDYALLKKSFKPFDTNDRYVKKHYKVNYENMIGKELKAKYAVVTSNAKNDEYDSPMNKVILLNTADAKYKKNVSYSDKFVRKYVSLSFKVDAKTYQDKKYWYSGNLDGFYDYSYDLENFAPSDYDHRFYDDNKSYGVSSDNDTFYSSKDIFILKSNSVKVFVLSSKWEEPKIPYFDPRLKEATYKTMQQAAIFRLQTPRKYIDILNIPKKVSFWQGNKEYALNNGDFLAITKKDSEWYYGDFIYPDGKFISGKINMDDLSDGDTSTQYITNYKFKIFHSINKQDDENDNLPMGAESEIYAIRVYDKNNKKIQTIRNAGYLTDQNNTLDMIDANFDGYEDMMIYSHDGGAGPNNGYNFYIYDPKSKQFEYDQTLSELTQIQVDTKAKMITAAWRNGAAQHGYEEYKWINGKLTMTKQTVETYTQNDEIQTVTCVNQKGKLKCKTIIEKDVNQ